MHNTSEKLAARNHKLLTADATRLLKHDGCFRVRDREGGREGEGEGAVQAEKERERERERERKKDKNSNAMTVSLRSALV